MPCELESCRSPAGQPHCHDESIGPLSVRALAHKPITCQLRRSQRLYDAGWRKIQL
eukprot:CAMPEP_0174750184 /NCGR_PEP_ID=MMETSP1094-20130205/97236_1 /TAXON_ID=156173 /ORGANISM="Chrysochromulina brevifilum, Strain UTEX LB 985" /LENGTH=55 /DNA_ID=CAMNT_0015955497 /DNA_START=101 /DNA_END=264 /DNA_ORIENTATION=+